MEINIPMSIKMGEDEIPLKDFSELYAYYVIFDVLNGLLKYLYAINIMSRCNGTLKYTKRYLRKHTMDEHMYQRLLCYLKDCGGHCDCEVLYNFSAEQYAKSGIYKEFSLTLSEIVD